MTKLELFSECNDGSTSKNQSMQLWFSVTTKTDWPLSQNEEKYMVIPNEAKLSWHDSTPFYDKNTHQLGVEREPEHYTNRVGKVRSPDERREPESFSSEMKNKTRVSLLAAFIQHSTGSSDQSN